MIQINPFSYWEQSLFQMIDLSHPYKLQNEDKEALALFIKERAQRSKEYYSNLIKDGVDEQQAKEDTRNNVLFAGLLFSPTDHIASFYYHAFNKELTVEERIELYNQSKDIFDKFPADSFYADPENEQKLEEELTVFFNK